MKFSYTLLKKLVPAIKSPAQLAEDLTTHAFEVESINGDTVDVAIPANRYSDAASHFGLARIISAIFGKRFIEPKSASIIPKKDSDKFSVTISDKNLCPRYSALYVEVSKITQSPQWLRDILVSCGINPINIVVDVMNYVMLEVGQPLHAFDADKIKSESSKPKAQNPKIFIRKTKDGEKIKTLDDKIYALNKNTLVIADGMGPLAIAGVKGGKRAEVDSHTRRIIIESANFNAASVYRTSRDLKLTTDASVRFGHGLNPVLVEKGIKWAAALLQELASAKIGDWVDVNPAKTSSYGASYTKKSAVVNFDVDKFNSLTGLNLKQSVCLDYLKKLGFAVSGQLVKAPAERTDIESLEDLAEEIVNLYGYDRLPSIMPHVPLTASGFEDQLTFKDNIRNILTGMGLNEVYNYSFVDDRGLTRTLLRQGFGGQAGTLTDADRNKGVVELANPISEDKKYLRPSLVPLLLKNIEDNLRFYDEIRIFEIGKTFQWNGQRLKENEMLGMALGSRSTKPSVLFLELKGITETLLQGVGLTDFDFIPAGDGLRVESDHRIVGFLSSQTVELDLAKLQNLVTGEKEYQPLPKYPAIIRDVSFLINRDVRVAEIQDLLENGSHLLEDVDLLDWYEDEKLDSERKSLTFRLVFQAADRTLTDAEVGKEMEKIVADLQEKFAVEMR